MHERMCLRIGAGCQQILAQHHTGFGFEEDELAYSTAVMEGRQRVNLASQWLSDFTSYSSKVDSQMQSSIPTQLAQDLLQDRFVTFRIGFS